MPTIEEINSYKYEPINNGLGLAQTTTDKIQLLQQNAQTKVENLVQSRGLAMPKTDSSFKQDVLLGLQDADTYRLGSSQKDVRAVTGTNDRFDAVELQHGSNSYDMYGKQKVEGEIGKSVASMRIQRQQVADLINKEYGTSLTPETVTQQDMLDVGNMQQVQALADIARTNNADERWQAPLIRNSTQLNLTGKGYTDENGKLVDGTGEIPLNIPITSRYLGAIGTRGGGQVGNIAGENITSGNAMDPRVNASKYYQGSTTNTSQGNPALSEAMRNVVANGDDNNYSENLIDAAQAGVGTFLARTGDTAVDALIRGAKGVTSNEYVNSRIEGEYVKNGDFVGLDKYKTTKEYGYNDANVVDAQKKISTALETKNFMDTVKAIGAIAKAGPEVLLTSTGDMAAAFAGPAGWLVWAGNFNNEILEERAKEVGGVDNLGAKDRLIAGATAIPAAMLNQFTKGNVGITEATAAIKEAVGKGGIAVAKQLGKKILEGAVGEAAEESTQEALVEIGKKLETSKASEIGSDKFWEQVITAGALAAGAGGTMSAAAGGKELLDAGKEMVTEKLGNSADPEDTGISKTVYGRKTRFESDLSNVSEEAKPAWTADIAKHAGEIWLSEDLKSDNEYAKNPTKVFEDATEKIAKLNGIDSQEGKDLIKSEIFKKVYELTNEHDKGVAVVTTEKANSLLSTILDTFKGNKYVENEAARVYKKELDTKFAEVRQRLDKEGIDTRDLSNNGILTKEELARLEETLTNMRTLGSESLTKLADSIGTSLQTRQERLGSQGGNTPKTKKTVEQVRNEIENIGFLTKGYKSLKDHKADIESFVTNEFATPEERSKTLDELETFVTSRSGKVDLFDRSGETVRVRSVGELKVFAKETLKDTNKLMDLVTEAFKETKDIDSKERLALMASSLDSAIEDLNKIVISKNSTKADIDLYRSLFNKEASMKGDDKQLEEYLSSYESKLNEEPVQEVVEPEVLEEEYQGPDKELTARIKQAMEQAKTDKVEIEPEVVKPEAKVETNDERLQALMDMSIEDPEMAEVVEEPVVEARVDEVSEDAVENDVVKLSAEDRKVYQDMIAKAEKDLEKYENIANALNKYPELRVDDANRKLDYQAMKNVDVKNIIKNIDKAIWIHQKRIARLMSDRNEATKEVKALDGIIKEYDNELTKLRTKAGKVQAKLNTVKDEKAATEQRMKYSYILVKEFKSLIKKLINNLNNIAKSIVNATKGKFAAETVKQNVLRDIDSINSQLDTVTKEIELLENIKFETESEESIKVDPQDRLRGINEKLAEDGLDYEQVLEARDRVKGIRDTIGYFKKRLGESNSFRNSIEKVLGNSVKGNGSSRRSLTNRLVNNESIMEIMPRVISDSEYGKERVDRALGIFENWEELHVQTRKNPDDRSKIEVKDRFMTQVSEADTAILSKLGLDKLFEDKSIEASVEKAMNVVSLLTIADMVEARRLNGSQLSDYVDGAFARIVTRTNKRSLELGIQNGLYVPTSTYAMNAGRRLLEELEIKLDTKNEQDKIDATNALGMIAIDNILGNTQNSISKGLLKTDDKGKIVRVTEATNKVKDNDPDVIRVIFLDDVKLQDKLREYSDAAIVFEYASERTDGGISFKPVIHKYGKLGRNSDVKMSNEEVDYLNRQGSIAWKFDSSFEDIFKNEAEGSVDKLVIAMIGTKEDVVAKNDSIDVESAIAKYEADKLDIERMVMAYELTQDNEFYIGWDYTVSNRSMMSNKMLNPQNSKLSRFIVSADDMVNDLTSESKTVEDRRKDLDNVYLGIAQAFDMDPDKYLDQTVIDRVKSNVIDIEVTADGEYVVKAISPELQEVIDSKDTLNGIRKILGVKSDHIMHVYQVVDLIRKIDAGGNIKSNLALEADGITNGMMSTVAQIGLNGRTSGYFVKCGSYLEGYNTVNGVEIDSHGKFKENGGLDFYQTPVSAFKVNLETISTEDNDVFKLVNDLVTDGADGDKAEKKWRSYLKPLVMVFAYGAGMDNISYEGSKSLVTKMIKKAKTNKELVEMVKVFDSELDDELIDKIIDMKKGTYNINTGRVVNDRNGTWNPSEELIDKLTMIVNGSISNGLSDAFNQEFQPIVEYRKAVKLVNQVNFIVARQGFKKVAKEKFGTDKFNQLSKEQVRDVKDEMIAKGVYYGSNNTNGSVQDYFKTEQDKENAGEYVTVNLTMAFSNVYRTKGYSEAKINQMAKKLASNVGAVGVIDIHSIDGSTMIKGHIKEVLNIFDALVLGTDFQTNNEQMKVINQVYYDLLMGHSILGNAVKKVTSEESSKLFEEALQDMTADERNDLKDDLIRVFNIDRKKATRNRLLGQVREVIETMMEVDSSRRDLVNTPASIKQYYVSDGFEGGVWNPTKLDGRYAVYDNDIATAMVEENMMDNMFKMMVMAATISKEDVKTNDGKMLENKVQTPAKKRQDEVAKKLEC